MYEGQSRRGRWFATALLLVCASACLAVAQVTYRASTGSTQPKLSVAVTDENGVAVPSARVSLQTSATSAPLRCETDFAVHCQFENLTGDYQLRVYKEGYYAVILRFPKVPVVNYLSIYMM